MGYLHIWGKAQFVSSLPLETHKTRHKTHRLHRRSPANRQAIESRLRRATLASESALDLDPLAEVERRPNRDESLQHHHPAFVHLILPCSCSTLTHKKAQTRFAVLRSSPAVRDRRRLHKRSRMLADARTVFDRPVAPGGLFARSECVLSDHRAAHQLAGLQRYRTGLRTRCSVGEGGRTTMGDLVW